MTAPKPPQQVSYIIHAMGVEEYTLKKAKPKFPKILGFIFGASAGGALTGGRHATVAEEQGVFDLSDIPAVLAQVERLKKRRTECLDSIMSLGRMEGYDYTRRETVYVMVGPTEKLLTAKGRPKFNEGDAYLFEGEAITAENLAGALARCDSAETRAQAVAQALAPACAVKKMKPLNFKKSR
jgi:hypothetical protein